MEIVREKKGAFNIVLYKTVTWSNRKFATNERTGVCDKNYSSNNNNERKNHEIQKNKDTHTGIRTAILHLNICFKHLV